MSSALYESLESDNFPYYHPGSGDKDPEGPLEGHE